jgi:DNA mismatch endonuclease (patch repair protein)
MIARLSSRTKQQHLKVVDVFDRAARSAVMRAVRSKGNRSTELKLVNAFRAFNVTGWRRHERLIGRPDFVFRAHKVAVFVDGCFWHGCSLCGELPRSNKDYWRTKIARNIKRDRKHNNDLRARGWKVIRVWEHDLRPEQLKKSVALIQKVLARNHVRVHCGARKNAAARKQAHPD